MHRPADCIALVSRDEEGLEMPGISWLSDPDEACRRAKAEGKLALIDFYSPV
jgi:hypothetical protein